MRRDYVGYTHNGERPHDELAGMAEISYMNL